MIRTREVAATLCLLTAFGCGKTRTNDSVSVRTPDGGLPDGSGGRSGTGGTGRVLSGGGGTTRASDAGAGGGSEPATGGRGAVSGGGASGGVITAGAPSRGGSDTGGTVATGGTFGGGGTFGSGGYYFGAGGSVATGGSPAAQCVWMQGCTFADGTTCHGSGANPSSDCCYFENGRCCESTGVCGDPVPPPGDWTLPIDASRMGSPGWKQSTDPFCPKEQSTYATGIWSDSRGVYVSETYVPQTTTNPMCPGCATGDVAFNDGTGWSVVAGSMNVGQYRVRGVDGGPLFLYGFDQFPMPGGPSMSCGLATLADGVRTCEPVNIVSDVSAVNDHLAFAAVQGDLVRWDGTHWGPETAVLPSNELMAIWADDSEVLGTGQSAGKIYALRNSAWNLEATNTLETFSAIFGLSANDVWAGTQQEHLFHYDGTSWSQVSWTGSGCSNGGTQPIVGIWGKGSTVYFATQTAIARWNGSAIEIVARWTCDQSAGNPTEVLGLWGNSETELFFLVTDSRDPRQSCSPNYVLYFDGSKFHRM